MEQNPKELVSNSTGPETSRIGPERQLIPTAWKITDIFWNFSFLSNFHVNPTLCVQWVAVRNCTLSFSTLPVRVDAKTYNTHTIEGENTFKLLVSVTPTSNRAKTTSQKFPSEIPGSGTKTTYSGAF
jgi:hypothetical protein